MDLDLLDLVGSRDVHFDICSYQIVPDSCKHIIKKPPSQNLQTSPNAMMISGFHAMFWSRMIITSKI